MNETARVIVERWLGALASGEVAAAVDAVAPDVVLHGIGSAVRGRSSVSFVLTSLRAAFPDLRLETEVLAAEGTWVIVRFTANRTQQIALFGLRAGDRREVTGVGCFSVRNQGIADVCVYVDAGQLVKQFGLRPDRTTSDGTESNEQSGSWLERFTGGTREIWLAGVGALGLPANTASACFTRSLSRDACSNHRAANACPPLRRRSKPRPGRSGSALDRSPPAARSTSVT